MATKKKAESDLAIGGIKLSREKLLSIGIVMLLTISGIATLVYYKDNYDNSNTGDYGWIDPIPRNSTTDATLPMARRSARMAMPTTGTTRCSTTGYGVRT